MDRRSTVRYGLPWAAVVSLCVLFALAGGGSVAQTAAGVDTERTTSAIDRSQEQWAQTDEPRVGQVACPFTHLTTPSRTVEAPTIQQVYPNPTTEGNVGEFVVLEVPASTNVSNWTLTDGYHEAALPAETVEGQVALTMDPQTTATLTDAKPVALDGFIRFAADGDTIELVDGDDRIDAITYDRAAQAEIWYRAHDWSPGDTVKRPATGTWWPQDGTCVAPASGTGTNATPFVLPDGPAVVVESIAGADERVLIGGYTFTSERVAHALLDAVDRGVAVEILIESAPVGGTPAKTEAIVGDLQAGGVEVSATGGPGSRYGFHHPKYAVVDESVLVATENWGPAGLDGAGSRGWGVIVDDPVLADSLAAVFDADVDAWDTQAGETFLEEATFVEDDDHRPVQYPTEHPPTTVSVESTELLVAPDNAQVRLVELIGDAEEELLIKQASVGGTDVPVLEATLDAARSGVSVRVLLDSTWYVEDDNRAVADELERTAAEEGLDIEAELVDPDGRFEKIHAKGVVIDGETVVVGSANWNANAFESNREVLLVAHGSEVAAYFATVFDDDWNKRDSLIPIEFGATVAVALVLAAYLGHRFLEFGDEIPQSTDDRRPGPAGSPFNPADNGWEGVLESSGDLPGQVDGALGEVPITIERSNDGGKTARSTESRVTDRESLDTTDLSTDRRETQAQTASTRQCKRESGMNRSPNGREEE